MAVYLNQFHVVKPKNCINQNDLLAWIIKCHQEAEVNASPEVPLSSEMIEKLFLRYGVKSAQIGQRYLECGAISDSGFDGGEIYEISKSQKNGVDITKRTEFFSSRAFPIFKTFYEGSESAGRPDHIIHVTCTGYVSPSAAQRIVAEESWGKNTEITHAYHMGCYAAMPAVRIANSLVISENVNRSNFNVDIVHTEMCALHMNPLAQTAEQMVVQTLFADGHIKYTASENPQAAGKNLKIIATYEKVIANSVQDMSWFPAPWGMQMNLSREVPGKIKLELKKFSNELFHKAGLELNEAMRSIFAIHPGGPKIIDAVQDVLELKDDQIAESKKVLFERGNMSSATLPHVWNEILANNYPIGTKVVSYAFGPGLTLFGSVFEVV